MGHSNILERYQFFFPIGSAVLRKVQLNLSTTVTLGTEKSAHCVERLKQESMYGLSAKKKNSRCRGGEDGGVAVSGEVVVSGVSSVPTPYLVCLEVKTLLYKRTTFMSGRLLCPLLYAANRLSLRFLQLLIWISYGKSKLAPTIQTSVNFRNSPVLNLRSLKTYHFQIWQFY